MVKINKIYTRTGDDGTTGLVGGGRIAKDSLRVTAFGSVDELNAWMGVIRTFLSSPAKETLDPKCAIIQNELFDLGAELATPPGSEWPTMTHISGTHITRLENWIDEVTTGIPELRSFVLPGGSPINAYLHLARTVCRRAERDIVTLSKEEKITAEIIHYVNRLSDLLFAMARYESHVSRIPEYLWKPGASA